MGFSEVAPFNPQEKIIEYQVASKARLTGLSVSDFNEELGSNAPAPGGGSVAALCGSMGASLAAMVAALTHDKKGYKEHNQLMDQLGARAQVLAGELLAAMDADTEAFDKVMACFRLPRKTDEQKGQRLAAIEEANKWATLVPLSVLESCPEVLDLAAQVADKGNKNSLSDAGVAGLMGRAAAYGAYYNVLINLASIEDQEWKAEIRCRADAALASADDKGQAVQVAVLERLQGAE